MKMRSLFWLVTWMMTVPFAAGAQEAEPSTGPKAEPAPVTARKDPFAEPVKRPADPFADLMPVKGPPPRKNLVSVNVLGIYFGQYQLEYQRALIPRLAGILSPSVWLTSKEVVPGLALDSTILGLNAGIVVGWNRDPLRGPGLMLGGGVLNFKTSGAVEFSKTTGNLKGGFVYRHTFRFGLSLGLGVGYLFMNTIKTHNIFNGVGIAYYGSPFVEGGLGWVF
jgi:hypothetical protein